jgi:hypothetical protein
MEKIKIFTMLVVTLFLGTALIPLCGAVELNGDVQVKVKEWLGIVSPKINVTNQSIDLLVNVTKKAGDGNNDSYIVDDKIILNLDIQDKTGREFFFVDRSMIYRIMLSRDIKYAMSLPGKLFNNWLPIKIPLKSVYVVNTLSRAKASNISLRASFSITNETFHSGGENFSLYIATVGLLPGNVNGFLGGNFPILDRKIIKLEVNYVEM